MTAPKQEKSASGREGAVSGQAGAQSAAMACSTDQPSYLASASDAGRGIFLCRPSEIDWFLYGLRSIFPEPDDDEYYWVDLIGLDVVNREGQALGRVVELLDTGAHSVLQVVAELPGDPPQRQERLIPFVAAYVDRVSLAERRITVDWGLDY